MSTANLHWSFTFARQLNTLTRADTLSHDGITTQTFLKRHFKEFSNEETFNSFLELIREHETQIETVASHPNTYTPKNSQNFILSFISDVGEDELNEFKAKARDKDLNPQSHPGF